MEWIMNFILEKTELLIGIMVVLFLEGVRKACTTNMCSRSFLSKYALIFGGLYFQIDKFFDLYQDRYDGALLFMGLIPIGMILYPIYRDLSNQEIIFYHVDNKEVKDIIMEAFRKYKYDLYLKADSDTEKEIEIRDTKSIVELKYNKKYLNMQIKNYKSILKLDEILDYIEQKIERKNYDVKSKGLLHFFGSWVIMMILVFIYLKERI
ncbi:MAG: hypothetical protein N4A57_15930 [Anaeromicrobium sp.]|uniref:hypothetical protein n=1 Tax=Anaeromicrobium sp. TaxID=1929132 RepID=UPI0025ECCA99|nr:hypothetical protein [Anaeromicrobium sp.]MCT4595737.1 hypothetical protein [Anaeromicrobium sp.]